MHLTYTLTGAGWATANVANEDGEIQYPHPRPNRAFDLPHANRVQRRGVDRDRGRGGELE